MKSKIILFAALLLINSMGAFGNESPLEESFFGGFVSWNFTNHTDVEHLIHEGFPEIDENDLFGMNFNVGANLTIPVTGRDEWIGMADFHLAYSGLTASYEKGLSEYEIDRGNGEKIYEDVTYVTDYDFSYLDLTLLYKQQIADSKFCVSGGFSYLLNTSGDARQIILVKNDEIGIDKTLNPELDTEYTSEIAGAESLFGAQVRLSYLFQKRKLFIEPFFSYETYFQSMVKNTDWKAGNFCFGVGIKFQV